MTDILTRNQLRSLCIDTSMYRYNTLPGVFEATIDFMAQGHEDILRLFFTFADGRKIIAPVYAYNRHLGFFTRQKGDRVLLIYEEVSRERVFLTDAKDLKDESGTVLTSNELCPPIHLSGQSLKPSEGGDEKCESVKEKSRCI